MNTAPAGRCQSAQRPWRAGRPPLYWLLVFAGVMVLSGMTAADVPAATPPAWQRDLDAALALQAALALAPTADPAADADRRARLGQLYGQFVARYPDQAEVQKAAGNYFQQMGQMDTALACWQRAETLDAKDGAVAENIGEAFLARGQIPDACRHFERAVEARPEVPAYHFALANVLYLFRREVLAPPARPDERAALAEALAHFRRAAELAPADLRLAQAYAETFYVFPQPDWTQALGAWKTVLLLSGTNTDFANGHLARVSLHLGRPVDAETYLGQIRSPAFDAMKTKFRQQAAAMNATPVIAPSGSPGTAP